MPTSPLIPPTRAPRALRLHVREWAATKGAPTALLIHGMGGDSMLWEHVAEHLQANGYRVIAPDLTGHGRSPRRLRYSPLSWINDVLHTFAGQPAPDLIIGHSLGGLIASGVALHLPNKPRVILVDPVWRLPRSLFLYGAKRSLLKMRTYSHASIHRTKPTWSGRQINVEMKALSRWDPRTVNGLDPVQSALITRRFQQLRFPTTILRPVHSLLIPGLWVPFMQRAGLRVITVPKTTHNLHRDDTTGFLTRLEEYLADAASASTLMH